MIPGVPTHFSVPAQVIASAEALSHTLLTLVLCLSRWCEKHRWSSSRHASTVGRPICVPSCFCVLLAQVIASAEAAQTFFECTLAGIPDASMAAAASFSTNPGVLCDELSLVLEGNGNLCLVSLKGQLLVLVCKATGLAQTLGRYP